MRVILIVCILLAGCSDEKDQSARPAAPVAHTEPTVLSRHGHERIDDYYWIRDDSRQNQRMLSLLEQENAYTQAAMSHTETLQASLFNEISSRLPSANKTVPVARGGYEYFEEYVAGGQYPIYKRRRQNSEEVLLDGNLLSSGYDHYEIGNFSVSPDNQLLAFAEDTLGRGRYRLRIKHIGSNEFLPEVVEDVSPSLAWAGEDLFYVKKHPQTLLPYQVYRLRAGQHELLYTEPDPAFYTRVYTSRSQKYVVISTSSSDSTEIMLLDAEQPTPQSFLPRELHHEYRIRHHGDWFYVLTNWQAKNFRLMRVATHNMGNKQHWREVIPHRQDVLLEDFEVFDDYLVLTERHQGLSRIRVVGEKDSYIEFSDPAYSARLHANPNPDVSKLRYSYTSLTRPLGIYEYDMRHGQSSLLKINKVSGDFDASNYESQRYFFTARDDTRVPVSLVYRKDRFAKGYNAGYIYAYGAYGRSTEPVFQAQRLSLLDRGFVVAIVHVRGGEEMGRQWYEDGRLLRKKNTFNDFIDGTRSLIEKGFVDENNVFATGASAGGLLMGVVINEASELYTGVVAHVPFVDVLTTMLDESIPLTSQEFTEWGDPSKKDHYEYLLSYSPYDQVKAQNYPNLLVTTGFHDAQVQYYEPVKWVSRLRQLKTDDKLLLLDIDMNTGHAGATDRYIRYRRDALEYAFILNLAKKS